MSLEIKHRVASKYADNVRADLAALKQATAACAQIAPGSTGPEVKSLQRVLRGLNLYSGKINGTYDEATLAAVKKLEAQTQGLTADGIFDAEELAEAKGRQMFVKDGLETPAHVGQKGGGIATLENKLHALGYAVGKRDGVYDGKLEAAVRAYREANPKLSDNVAGAGKNVLRALRADIHNLEAHLKKLGRKPGKVDGKFTKKTARAVRAFQKKHHLKVTGRANKRTRAAIAKEANGGVSDKTKRFIQIAKNQIGDPYVFGTEGPDRFDCSGLIYYALKQAGVSVPRLTADGYMNMYRNNRVSRENLKPGDLVFYHYANTRGIPAGHATHIEIYLGNGMTMGTDNPSEGARVEPIDWSGFIGGARVPGLR